MKRKKSKKISQNKPTPKTTIKSMSNKSSKDIFDEIEKFGIFKLSYGENGSIKIITDKKLTSDSLRSLYSMKTSLYTDKFDIKKAGLNINFTLDNYNLLLLISDKESKLNIKKPTKKIIKKP